ncbi:MAG: hypothetical protein ACI8QC_002405, partial [Planctomycetota bacterium]
GRSLLERHLVGSLQDLPPRVSSLLGAKLPPDDPRTDAILARLSEVPACRGLQQLDLSRTSAGSEGLKHLARWAWLESLDLSHTQVSLEDLAPLKDLPELRQLSLDGTPMGALDFGDLFGQIDIPPSLRHPIAALQRGLGRLLDLQLLALVLSFALPTMLVPSWPAWSQSSVLAALAALLLIPLEALGLSLMGRTPGKAMLRVAVISEDAVRPSLLRGLQRAACVWLLGFGAGLRPASWAAASYWTLAIGRGANPPWDRVAGTRCVPRHCSGKRLLAAFVLNLALLVL